VVWKAIDDKEARAKVQAQREMMLDQREEALLLHEGVARHEIWNWGVREAAVDILELAIRAESIA
jgi:hypothetical protein